MKISKKTIDNDQLKIIYEFSIVCFVGVDRMECRHSTELDL